MTASATTAKTFQWVLCDLGGVAVHVDSARAITELARQAQRPSAEIIQLFDADLLAAFEEGRSTPQQFFEGLSRPLGLAISYEAFVELWNNLFTENADVTAILRRLRTQCQLAALSNTNELHFNYLMATMPETMRLFHALLPSHQLGMRKPDERLYLTALERMGATPWGTVYIDDREDLVAVGRRLGLQTIQFRDATQLRQDLQRVGFEV